MIFARGRGQVGRITRLNVKKIEQFGGILHVTIVPAVRW